MSDELANIRSKILTNSNVPLQIFCVVNFLLIGADIFVVHRISNVQTPIALAAPVLAVGIATLLLFSLLVSRTHRLTATLLLRLSILIAMGLGLVGLWLHLQNFITQRSIASLVYSAPFAAPVILCGLGLVVASTDDGILTRAIREKIRFFLVSGFFGGNYLLALFDHSQNGFFHPTEWLPVIVSALGCAVWLSFAIRDHQVLRGLMAICGMAAGVTGLMGVWFHLVPVLNGGHLNFDILERVPLTAPLLMLDAWILGELVRLGSGHGFLKIK